MIFAEVDYDSDYGEVHDELVSLLEEHFSDVESGHQGASWVWINDGATRDSVDTFSSMKHQVKSASPGPHVRQVLDVLGRRFRLIVRNPPEMEPHECS